MTNNFPFLKTISGKQINCLPINQFNGNVFLINCYNDLKQVKKMLDKEKYLGFDTETRPSFKKGKSFNVSLLQFANSGNAYLIRINKIGLPEEIIEILENPNIKKIGVALKDDIASLKKISKFEPRSFIDLQQFVKNFGIEDNSLKKIVAIILRFRISKRQQISNWELDELTEAQINYAATDAWVCQKIYSTLIEMEKSHGRNM